jgi:hypothetical protein
MNSVVVNALKAHAQYTGKRAVVVYHANCMDGLMAAYNFEQACKLGCFPLHTNPPKYLAKSYTQDLSKSLEGLSCAKDWDLFILDFSFDPELYPVLCNNYNTVTLIDHHKTAIEALDKWNVTFFTPSNFYAQLNLERSGAGLVQEYFGLPIDKISYLVEDRDLWKFTLEGAKPFHTFLSNLINHEEHEEDKFDKIDTIYLPSAISAGEQLDSYFNKLCADIIKASKRKIVICGIEGLVCNAPPMFASEIGNLLVKESGTFGATYYHASDDAVNFSLRADGAIDVSALAKTFGGGGHRTAAGFRLTKPADGEPGITLWNIPNE